MIGIMNLAMSFLLTNGFTQAKQETLMQNSNKINCDKSLKTRKTFKVTPFFNHGSCMIKNKQGEHCPMKKTYIIDCIGKCMCEYHLKNKEKLYDILFFYKKINLYIKRLYLYYNNNDMYIENLKDILLLFIKYEKYKYILDEHFNLTNVYIENFDIKDDEYLALVDYFKSIWN